MHHQLEVQSFGDYLNFVLDIPASNNKLKESINELTKNTERLHRRNTCQIMNGRYGITRNCRQEKINIENITLPSLH